MYLRHIRIWRKRLYDIHFQVPPFRFTLSVGKCLGQWIRYLFLMLMPTSPWKKPLWSYVSERVRLLFKHVKLCGSSPRKTCVCFFNGDRLLMLFWLVLWMMLARMAILTMARMSSTAATGSRTTWLFHWRIIKNAIKRNTSACAFDSITKDTDALQACCLEVSAVARACRNAISTNNKLIQAASLGPLPLNGRPDKLVLLQIALAPWNSYTTNIHATSLQCARTLNDILLVSCVEFLVRYTQRPTTSHTDDRFSKN